MAAAEAGRAVILVRAETSPDDVHGMARAAGILTARGGLASHAAVVARGWGIPAVVGARRASRSATARSSIGDRVLHAGDVITIDGGTGEVFEGAVAGATEVVPEARTLLALGRGARHPDRRAMSAGGSRACRARRRQPVTPDDCLRAIAHQGLRHSRRASPTRSRRRRTTVQPLLDALVADGLVATVGGRATA